MYWLLRWAMWPSSGPHVCYIDSDICMILDYHKILFLLPTRKMNYVNMWVIRLTCNLFILTYDWKKLHLNWLFYIEAYVKNTFKYVFSIHLIIHLLDSSRIFVHMLIYRYKLNQLVSLIINHMVFDAYKSNENWGSLYIIHVFIYVHK